MAKHGSYCTCDCVMIFCFVSLLVLSVLDLCVLVFVSGVVTHLLYVTLKSDRKEITTPTLAIIFSLLLLYFLSLTPLSLSLFPLSISLFSFFPLFYSTSECAPLRFHRIVSEETTEADGPPPHLSYDPLGEAWGRYFPLPRLHTAA